MKILYEENELSYSEFLRRLNITSGNFLSHIRFLEEEKFIEFRKDISGHRVCTVYIMTEKGRKEYEKFRKLMLEVLR